MSATEGPLTAHQLDLVQATIPLLRSHGTVVTESFYSSLLHDVPSLSPIFNASHMRSGQQAAALAKAVLLYAEHLTRPEVLGGTIEGICQKHVSLGVERAQYAVVGQYLLKAFTEVLGRETFTKDIEGAWAAAYDALADLMAGREEELYKASEADGVWREMKIARKVKESENGVVTSFHLAPSDGKGLPVFKPGQYLSVQVALPGGKLQTRQYSLSSASTSSYPSSYRITPKKELGRLHSNEEAVSRVLHEQYEEGNTLRTSTHPRGVFYLDVDDIPDKSSVVFISAGIGLTPLLSMLESLAALSEERRSRLGKIRWVHGTRGAADVAFDGEVREALSSFKDGRGLVLFSGEPSRTSGEASAPLRYHTESSRVTLDGLAALEGGEYLCLDDPFTLYFICGPGAFMDDLRDGLIKRNVQEERIKMEKFGV
jgi:nitric oxide dioxygenase